MKILDVLYALVFEFNNCDNSIKNTFEQSENIKPPFFLHSVSFISDTRHNFFAKKVRLDIHTVYIGTSENNMISSLEHNLEIREKLLAFLDLYTLKVKDRFFHFDYKLMDIDGLLGINITLQFMDNIVDTKWSEEQKRELIQIVNIKYNL